MLYLGQPVSSMSITQTDVGFDEGEGLGAGLREEMEKKILVTEDLEFLMNCCGVN